MGKQFKNQPCAYCPDGISVTGDHVFPRAFFPASERANLPQVPACERCNNTKSRLETNLATVLLFGGRHGDAKANLVANGERRLKRNLALHRKLQSGAERVWLKADSGLVVRSMGVPVDDVQFTKFFEYVVKGLMRYEFGVTLGADDYVEVHTVTVEGGEPLFRKFLGLNAANRAKRDVGHGAFVYEGSQGQDYGHISIWLLSAFGGLLFQDEHGRSYETRIGALTGPRRVADKVALRQKWLEGRGAFPAAAP